jgi:integrase
MRFGEGAALAVEDVDLTARCLLVRRAYSAKRKRIDGTKSGEPREVALHPILVRALRYQIEVVYPTIYGAPPGPSDLICPRLVVRGPAAGTRAPRRPESSLRRLQNYAEQLGIPRTCTQHDFRATLISLAEEDGADRWILERMTHRAGGPLGERNAYERYVRSSLEAKLREIDKLRLDVLSPAQQLRFGGGGF